MNPTRREEVVRLLGCYARDEIETEQFLAELEDLNARGLLGAFTDDERKKVNHFFSWIAGMYDPLRPPRSGVTGRLSDLWAQISKGEYRVSIQRLKLEAALLEKSLQAGCKRRPNQRGQADNC